MRADFFLCISVLRVASGARVRLAGCKSGLHPLLFVLLTVLKRWSRCWSYSCCFVVYPTRRLLLVLPVVILFLCFSVL